MTRTASRFDQHVWKMAATCLVIYGLWQLAAVLYGVLPFHFAKYFVIVAAVSGVFHFCLRRINSTLSHRELLTILLLFTIVLAITFQLLFIPDVFETSGRSAQYYLVAATAFNFFWLLWGYALQLVGSVRKSNVIALALVLVVAALILGALDGSVVLQYRRFSDNIAGEFDLSHLTIGESTYLLLVASYALASGWAQPLIFCVTLPILFALGGRADVGIYVVSIVSYEWLRGAHGSKLIHVMIALALAIGVFASLPSSVLEDAGIARMIFVGGLGEDTSYAARHTFLIEDITSLPGQVPAGDVTQLVRYRGGVGTYIHNLLSAWQFYGLPAFALIVYLLLSNMGRIRRLARNAMDALGPFGVLVFLSAIVGAIVAKSVTHHILWLALGYCAGSVPFREAADRARYVRNVVPGGTA